MKRTVSYDCGHQPVERHIGQEVNKALQPRDAQYSCWWRGDRFVK